MNNYWENFCDALFFFLLEHFCKNISNHFMGFSCLCFSFAVLLPCFARRLILIDCLTRDFGIWYLIYGCKNILKRNVYLFCYFISAFDARERQHWVNRLRATSEYHTESLTVQFSLWSYVACCIIYYQCIITNHLCICVLQSIAICL